VEGDEFGQRILAFTGDSRQPCSGRGVQPAAFRARQGLIRDLADQDVPKSEGVSARGSKQILVDQPVEHVTHVVESRLEG
jgi:hypothetical protein